jgi:hypothetical protein
VVASSVDAESDLWAAPWPGQSLVGQLVGELRWAFTPPWTWLTGVAVNLVLSLLWLLVTPLTGRPDWAILVGVYFAVFILADVTTTNVLGADALRVRLSLLRGLRVRRVLLLKNLALFLVVGVPTLLLTAVITVCSEADYRLLVTVPRVMYPTLTWLGVGDLVSVMLPVAIIPLRQRWQQRRQIWRSARWLMHLVLPYALLCAVNPFSKLPTITIVALHLCGDSALIRAVVVCGLGRHVGARLHRRTHPRTPPRHPNPINAPPPKAGSPQAARHTAGEPDGQRGYRHSGLRSVGGQIVCGRMPLEAVPYDQPRLMRRLRDGSQ